MSALPYIPLFVTDYESDTLHLNFEEHGIYLKLMMLVWKTSGCRIPNDPKWIMRRLGVDDDGYISKVQPIISEFFQSNGNYITQKRLRKEFLWAKEKQKKATAAAKSRWNNNKSSSERISERNAPNLTQPNPTHTKKKTTQKKKTLIPSDWKPNERSYEIGTREGYSPDEVAWLSERFGDWAVAAGKTYIDWDRGFYSWVRSGYSKKDIQARRAGNKDAGGKGFAAAARAVLERASGPSGAEHGTSTPPDDPYAIGEGVSIDGDTGGGSREPGIEGDGLRGKVVAISGRRR